MIEKGQNFTPLRSPGGKSNYQYEGFDPLLHNIVIADEWDFDDFNINTWKQAVEQRPFKQQVKWVVGGEIISIKAPFIMISNHSPSDYQNVPGVFERLFIVETSKLNITWPPPSVEFITDPAITASNESTLINRSSNVDSRSTICSYFKRAPLQKSTTNDALASLESIHVSDDVSGQNTNSHIETRTNVNKSQPIPADTQQQQVDPLCAAAVNDSNSRATLPSQNETDSNSIVDQLPGVQTESTSVINQLPLVETELNSSVNQPPYVEPGSTSKVNQPPRIEIESTLVVNQLLHVDIQSNSEANQPLQNEIESTLDDNQPLHANTESTPVDNQPIHAENESNSEANQPLQNVIESTPVDNQPLHADIESLQVETEKGEILRDENNNISSNQANKRNLRKRHRPPSVVFEKSLYGKK